MRSLVTLLLSKRRRPHGDVEAVEDSDGSHKDVPECSAADTAAAVKFVLWLTWGLRVSAVRTQPRQDVYKEECKRKCRRKMQFVEVYVYVWIFYVHFNEIWAQKCTVVSRAVRFSCYRFSDYTVWVKKSSPPKTFCDIFTHVKYISVKICQHVVSSYLHKSTNIGRLILIFNKTALIFLAVPTVFNVFSFKFHQVKSA